HAAARHPHTFPTRRSSDLAGGSVVGHTTVGRIFTTAHANHGAAEHRRVHADLNRGVHRSSHRDHFRQWNYRNGDDRRIADAIRMAERPPGRIPTPKTPPRRASAAAGASIVRHSTIRRLLTTPHA